MPNDNKAPYDKFSELKANGTLCNSCGKVSKKTLQKIADATGDDDVGKGSKSVCTCS